MEPSKKDTVGSDSDSSAVVARAGSPTPTLKHRKDFEAVLASYHMSDAALAMLAQTPLMLMVSVSGVGRNTIINRLIDTGNYHLVVSDTTRPMRLKDGVSVEREGVEYFFRNEADVLSELQRGEFIEAKIIHNQQVSGISMREIKKAHDSGRIATTDVTVPGFETIAQVKPDTVGIFLLPPSFEEWLTRIKKRSTLANEELKNRLESSLEEFGAALEDARFIFVINDNLDEAVRTVDAISRLGQHNREIESRGHELAEQLREEATLYLRQYPNWQ